MNDKASTPDDQSGDERRGLPVKAAAGVAGLLYVGGYAVVSIHLSRLNIYPIELIRFHYLAAGLWLFLPPVLFALPFVWLGAILHDAYREKRTSTHDRRGAILRVIAAIPVHAYRIFKSLLMAFGALVALIGCYCGLRADRSAAGVGAATTTSVVASIVTIIAVDAVFAVCANALGV